MALIVYKQSAEYIGLMQYTRTLTQHEKIYVTPGLTDAKFSK